MDREKKMELARSRAKVIKALGHPSRMFMVSYLAESEASVKELTEAVGADISTVSKHLSILKQVGILTDRKDGNRVLYSLICPCIMNFINCIDSVIYKEAEKGLQCVLPDVEISDGQIS